MIDWNCLKSEEEQIILILFTDSWLGKIAKKVYAQFSSIFYAAFDFLDYGLVGFGSFFHRLQLDLELPIHGIDRQGDDVFDDNSSAFSDLVIFLFGEARVENFF